MTHSGILNWREKPPSIDEHKKTPAKEAAREVCGGIVAQFIGSNVFNPLKCMSLSFTGRRQRCAARKKTGKYSKKRKKKKHTMCAVVEFPPLGLQYYPLLIFTRFECEHKYPDLPVVLTVSSASCRTQTTLRPDGGLVTNTSKTMVDSMNKGP